MITIDEFIERNKDWIGFNYVAMDKNGDWFLYGSEPTLAKNEWIACPDTTCCLLINIAPVDNWTKSLRKVG